MAVPGYIDGSGSLYPAKITPYVFFTCLLASSGGLIYGYDVVVAGGVSIMEDFLIKFYPSVYRKKQDVKQDNYCKYDNQVFQLYTSCLYMAALLATFIAGLLTRKRGYRNTMLTAGIFFIVGTILGVAAENLSMLMLGRVFLECGLGFSNQAIPLYLSEIAPSNYRGRLNMLFSVNVWGKSGELFGIKFASMGLEILTRNGRSACHHHHISWSHTGGLTEFSHPQKQT
ncbi:hypothetical protein L7F22_021909 [Adiantum nelumboides]|nr:hypothetical protein [Adiantum nelumboides]